MINVNIELFKRTTPVKKIEIIENLTQTELGRVTEETILKIVKELLTTTENQRYIPFKKQARYKLR